MLKLATLAVSFAFVTLAHATSLHPCTPTVRAMPTHIYCIDGKNAVSILINTLMSPPIEMCQGNNYYESKSALVTLTEGAKPEFLYGSEFEYTLSPIGDASFASEKLNLDLTKCVTPIHGGVSFGN
jgi:hypothetical protein